MDAASWTVIGAAIAILAAIATAFPGLRANYRELGRRIDAQGEDLRRQGRELGEQVGQLREQIGQLRERMAHLGGLLEGLREAITGKRVA